MRPDLSLTLGALGLLGLAACGQATSPDGDIASPTGDRAISVSAAPDTATEYGKRARARVFGSDGERIGDVMAWQGRDGVLVQLDVRDLPPGPHGVHFHSVGDCEDTGAFKASGAHIGVADGPHGLLHPDGPHRGNLPNIHVGVDGTAIVEFYSNLISVAELRDADGAALIIHQTRDDLQTQPIGGSGGRIACAPFGGRS
ncbi:MAG: superoxide dismutase [Parvularcula sp.]|nr:superoxide dismutase [Parvularcula sp.]